MAQAQPAVTWYWRGSSATNGTTLAVNTQSSLVLGCAATAKAAVKTAGNVVAFVLTKGGPISAYTQTTAASGTAAKLTTTGTGTTIYDSINGNTAGFDHVITSVSINNLNATYSNGYLTMYIPSISSSDAGSYYCNYIGGSYDATDAASIASSTPLSFANSGSFTLSVTTKSGSGSQSVSGSRSKALEYSLLLLGASKMLL